MAAADITLNAKWATIESDTDPHRINLNGVGGSITNIGATRVYLGIGVDSLEKDDLQHDGEIYLDQNDSVPVPANSSPIIHATAAGTTKLWFIPRMG